MPDGRPRDLAVSALEDVTFATDGNSARLSAPVSFLIAANWDLSGTARVFSRDDATGVWAAASLAQNRPTPGFVPQVRSLAGHRNRMTGIDHVFAGQDPRGIFSGTCDRINLLGGGRIRTLPQSSGRASEFARDSPLEQKAIRTVSPP